MLGKEFNDIVKKLVDEGKRECDIVKITGHSRNAVRKAMQECYVTTNEAVDEIVEILGKIRDSEKYYKCPLCNKSVIYPCVKCMTHVLSTEPEIDTDTDILELDDIDSGICLKGEELSRYLKLKEYRDTHNGKSML